MSNINMFNYFVDKWYTNDPQTEDVIYGDDLKNGMIVLLNRRTIHREDPKNIRNENERERLLTQNRYCEVTGLRRRGDLVQFIGVYPGGTKVDRTYSNSYTWIVRKDTM